MKKSSGESLTEKFTREINESAGCHSERNQKLRKEEQEISCLIQRYDTQHISHQEIERIFRAWEEVFPVDRSHDVGISVHELQEVF